MKEKDQWKRLKSSSAYQVEAIEQDQKQNDWQHYVKFIRVSAKRLKNGSLVLS